MTDLKTYVHKPTPVCAVRFDPHGAHRHELPAGLKCHTALPPDLAGDEHGYGRRGLIFSVQNNRGWMKAFAGDWLVYGATGVTPLSPAIFEASYQEAT